METYNSWRLCLSFFKLHKNVDLSRPLKFLNGYKIQFDTFPLKFYKSSLEIYNDNCTLIFNCIFSVQKNVFIGEINFCGNVWCWYSEIHSMLYSYKAFKRIENSWFQKYEKHKEISDLITQKIICFRAFC